MSKSLLLILLLLFQYSCGFIAGSNSREYKIEKAKIYLDEAKWDKALEALKGLTEDNEVIRLRAGAYGGKAGVSVIQMGLKFIGKSDSEEGSDFFNFLQAISLTEHVLCGEDPCIALAITEINKVKPTPLPSDYFLSAFFRLYKASVSFLELTTITELKIDDLLVSGVANKQKLSCFVNTFQIEITAIESDLENANIVSDDLFFKAVNEVFSNLTFCSGYVAGEVDDLLCKASKKNEGLCKWACSSVVVAEGGNYNVPGDEYFDGYNPDGSLEEPNVACIDGGVVLPALLEWGGVNQPAEFKTVTDSEAIGGLIQNVGAK